MASSSNTLRSLWIPHEIQGWRGIFLELSYTLAAAAAAAAAGLFISGNS
jgi:hypothetical protein